MLYFLSQARGICSIQPINNFLVLNKSNNVHLLRNQCINKHFRHLFLNSHDLCHFKNIFPRLRQNFSRAEKSTSFNQLLEFFIQNLLLNTKKLLQILEIFRCFLANMVDTIVGPLLFCGVGIFQHLFNTLYYVIW